MDVKMPNPVPDTVMPDPVPTVEPKFETPVGFRDENAQDVVMKVVDPVPETEKLVMGVDLAKEPDKTTVTGVSGGKIFNFPIPSQKADEIMVALPEAEPGESPQEVLQGLDGAIAKAIDISPDLLTVTPPMQTGGLPEKTVVEKVLDVIVDMAPAGLKEAVADALGVVTQPELPQQPIALQVDNVAEVVVIPEAPPRVVVPPTIPIRIQKRVARDGTEIYRVHREGDPFYFWTAVYTRASAFAKSLFHPGCYYEDCNAHAV